MTLDLDSIILDSGAHDPNSGAGCVMEWASVLAGEEWSDSPRCTSPVIAAFLRAWNDSLPDDERQQLKRYIPLVVGTNRGPEMDERLAWMVTDWLVRVQAPAWLRLAGLTEQAALLEGMPEVTAASDAAAAMDAARPAVMAAAWDAARAARGAAVMAAAWDAARDAARAAAMDAAAWAAAMAAARDAARAAAMDAATAAASAAARDAARGAARDAATAALDPTKRDLQAKAHDLLDRMITVASVASEEP